MKIVEASVGFNKVSIQLPVSYPPDLKDTIPGSKDFYFFLKKERLTYLDLNKPLRGGESLYLFSGPVQGLISLMEVYYGYDNDDIVETLKNIK